MCRWFSPPSFIFLVVGVFLCILHSQVRVTCSDLGIPVSYPIFLFVYIEAESLLVCVSSFCLWNRYGTWLFEPLTQR